MSYTGSHLAEYPVPVENGLDNDDSGKLTFLHREEDEGVAPPPTPTGTHVNTWIANIQYDSAIHIHHRRMATIDSVDAAFRSGYIISAPGEMAFSEQHGQVENDYTIPSAVASFHADEYLTESTHPEVTGNEYPTYKLDLRWAVDVPDGYSVLVTSPFFLEPDEYSVVPEIHDCDESFTWLTATIVLHDAAFRIKFGEPVVQVIPFKRSAARLPAVIDRTPPEK